jgi:predicted aspartyl protease
MKKSIILLLISIILSGCSIYNHKRIKRSYNKGNIVQKDFTYRIPFRFEHDLIFVIVNIEGEDYNFVFDTGAQTSISYEVFEKLNYKKKGFTASGSDSQRNFGHVFFTSIPMMKLGELTYKDIGSQIIDLRKNQEYRCLNIDGLFGSNHMSKAIWEIDYENQVLHVTNDIKNINLLEPYYPIDFITEQFGKTPKINLSIDGRAVDRITYDTGSNGYISLSEYSLNFVNESFENVDYYGYSSGVGAFGMNKSQAITSITKVPLLELGKSEKLSIHNNLIMISRKSLLGNKFLKNYRAVLDWNQNIIYLTKVEDYEKTSYKSFGFGWRIIDNNLIVTRTIQSSNLKVNDKIISINGRDFSDLNEDSACDFFLNPEISKEQTLEIVVLREGEQLTETIELITLIE